MRKNLNFILFSILFKIMLEVEAWNTRAISYESVENHMILTTKTRKEIVEKIWVI